MVIIYEGMVFFIEDTRDFEVIFERGNEEGAFAVAESFHTVNCE